MKKDFERIYDQLQFWGLTNNQYDFSTRWLGQCDSYFSSMKARDAEPGPQAALALLSRLRCFNERLRANDRVRTDAQMGQLANMLTMEAETISNGLYETSLQRVAERQCGKEEQPL